MRLIRACLAVLVLTITSLAAPIHVNREGFVPLQKKEVMVSGPVETFEVIRLDNGKVALTGKAQGPTVDPITGEEIYRLNLTQVTRGGEYLIRVDGLGESPVFSLNVQIYNPLYRGSMGAITAHRQERGGWITHPDGSSSTLSMTGIIGPLFILYEAFPKYFADGLLDIPEENNKIPDILDEMAWGLKGLLASQRPDGSIPVGWDAQGEPWGEGTAETAAFAAVAARAHQVYRQFDPQLSHQALEAAQAAWRWVENRPFTQTPGGSVPRQTDLDARLWALTELLLVTGEESYIMAWVPLAQEALLGEAGVFNSHDFTSLAFFRFTLGNGQKINREIDQKVREFLLMQAKEYLVAASEDPYYRAALDHPEFPSHLAQIGTYLLLANEVEAFAHLRRVANDQLHYLLGRNPQGKSYIAGFGGREGSPGLLLLEDGYSLEWVAAVAFLAAEFKDSSELSPFGQALQLAFQLVAVFAILSLGMKAIKNRKVKQEED